MEKRGWLNSEQGRVPDPAAAVAKAHREEQVLIPVWVQETGLPARVTESEGRNPADPGPEWAYRWIPGENPVPGKVWTGRFQDRNDDRRTSVWRQKSASRNP